jgi:hypothetical protein
MDLPPPARRGGGRRPPRRQPGLRLGCVVVAAAAVTAACEMPTGLPRFESRFVIPLDQTRITLDDLLPASVRADGSEFTIGSPPTLLLRQTLGQICSSCPSVQGQRVPKPAFTHSFSLAADLPRDVVSAELWSGLLGVVLRHGFDFDLLRPAGAGMAGSIVITVSSGGVPLGSAIIDEPFPPGTPLVRMVQLGAGALTGSLDVHVAVASPAGSSSVRIDSHAALEGTAVLQELRVSQARVRVPHRQITSQSVLDLTGVDEEIRRRLRGGALVLALSNPFEVAGELQLRLQATAPAANHARAVAIAPGESAVRVELTREQLVSLLGQRVTATLHGVVSATADAVTVRPGQELTVTPHMDLVIEIGS